jgi:hypothetical protein
MNEQPDPKTGTSLTREEKTKKAFPDSATGWRQSVLKSIKNSSR